jgi:hypothetical protein
MNRSDDAGGIFWYMLWVAVLSQFLMCQAVIVCTVTHSHPHLSQFYLPFGTMCISYDYNEGDLVYGNYTYLNRGQYAPQMIFTE